MKLTLLAAASAAALSMATAASAATVVLDFENINATYPSGFAQVLDYYNGGLSSDGTSGTNYGISFDSNALALCLDTAEGDCSNTSRGGLAPGSDRGALIFINAPSTTLSYGAGFDVGFSFFYAQPNTLGGSVTVFDDVGGMGNILGTLSLGQTPNGACDNSISNGAAYCPFEAASIAFSGTGRSVVFGGVANFVVFDDITFGSITPGAVPEPSTWAMAILGMGGAGAALRHSRRRRDLALA